MSKRFLVYFFKSGDALSLGVCKGNFYYRQETYQTHSPYPVELLGVIACETEKDMWELEKTLIKRFSEHKLRGEWFKPAPEILTWIQEHACFELGQQVLEEGLEHKNEQKRKRRRNNPEYRKRHREYKRERYKDPEVRKRKNERERERRRERYQNDPEHREREREYQRKYRQRKKSEAQQGNGKQLSLLESE